MIRRIAGRICPACADEVEPVHEHPALRSMARTEGRLDHLLRMVARMRYDLDGEESGNFARDMLSGDYGEDDAR